MFSGTWKMVSELSYFRVFPSRENLHMQVIVLCRSTGQKCTMHEDCRELGSEVKKEHTSPWILWKHRNACVFDRSPPNPQVVIQAFKDEDHFWQFAGAKGLTTLSLELGGTQA